MKSSVVRGLEEALARARKERDMLQSEALRLREELYEQLRTNRDMTQDLKSQKKCNLILVAALEKILLGEVSK